MALYVPAGRRRRNLVIALAATAVVALAVGLVIGRITAPTVDDRVTTVQGDARAVVGTLAATPNEYRKERAGSSEFRAGGGVEQALAGARRSLVAAIDDATWLGVSQRGTATSALDAVIAADKKAISTAAYDAEVAQASRRIEQVFGIDG